MTAPKTRRYAKGSRGFNLVDLAESMARPGNDTREWLSMGTVDDDDPVEFDPDYGPLVTVNLQPGKQQARCRVGAFVAGKGEGEYYPFAPGDEVLVAMPEGKPINAVIIARLTNSIDTFPMGSVAGQDPTTNLFGFRRTQAGFVTESNGPILFRNAASGALFGLDASGGVTITDGENSGLQFGPDLFGYMSGDTQSLLQLDIAAGRFTAQAKDALLVLSSSEAVPQKSGITVPGSFAVATAAQPAGEHVLTVEAMMNILSAFFATFALVPLPLTGTALATAWFGSLPPAPATMPWLTAAASSAVFPAVAPILQATIAAQPNKGPPVPTLGQLAPGIACKGFFAG